MGFLTPPPSDPPGETTAAEVFLLTREELHLTDPPWFIDLQPVTAIAPHPERDDLVYITTGHPELLAFLPDPYVELI